MPILTAQQAADVLLYDTVDEMPNNVTSVFLPAIDGYLQNATGFDWGTLTATYTAIDPVAVAAASLLLKRWFEDSAEIGNGSGIGVISLVGQLQAKYLQETRCQNDQTRQAQIQSIIWNQDFNNG